MTSLRSAAYACATVGGLGYSPHAPGTVCSVAAVAVAWFLPPLVSPCMLVLLIMVTLAGTVAAEKIVREEKIDDPSWIVIDEWVGMWVSLLGLAHTPRLFFTALVVFRLLDIAKPFPVSWAERLPGGVGVMADDLVAGLITLVFMNFFLVPYGW